MFKFPAFFSPFLKYLSLSNSHAAHLPLLSYRVQFFSFFSLYFISLFFLALCPQASPNESRVLGTADWLVGVYAIIIEMTLKQICVCGSAVDLILCYAAVSSQSHRWVCMAGRLWSQYSILLLLDFTCWCESATECLSSFCKKYLKDFFTKLCVLLPLHSKSLKSEN